MGEPNYNITIDSNLKNKMKQHAEINWEEFFQSAAGKKIKEIENSESNTVGNEKAVDKLPDDFLHDILSNPEAAGDKYRFLENFFFRAK